MLRNPRQGLTAANLPWILVLLGAFLRVHQYLADRSLWLDESLIALNILDRSFGDLLEALDFNQAAPAGFLFIEKLLVQWFGTSEYVFRLVPLAAGLLALPLFLYVARRVLSATAAAVAVGLFAVSDPVVSFASEAKPYSSDLFVALLLTAGALWLSGRSVSTREVSGAAAVGAISVWISYPAAFVLAGIGLALALTWALEHQWRKLRALLLFGAVWLGSFVTALIVTRSSVGQVRESFTESSSTAGAEGGFIDFPPSSVSDFAWLPRSLGQLATLGSWPGWASAVVAVLCLLGCWGLYRTRRFALVILITPALFVVLAAAADRYPLGTRFVLFLAPAFILLLARGTEIVSARLRELGPVLQLAVLTLVFAYPAFDAARHVVNPREKQEIEPAIEYIAERWRDGDALYVYFWTQYAFRYYMECDCMTDSRADGLWSIAPARGRAQTAPALRSQPPGLLVGLDGDARDADELDDLDRLQGRDRAWLLFTHASEREEAEILGLLPRTARSLAGFREGGAAVHLYALRP